MRLKKLLTLLTATALLSASCIGIISSCGDVQTQASEGKINSHTEMRREDPPVTSDTSEATGKVKKPERTKDAPVSSAVKDTPDTSSSHDVTAEIHLPKITTQPKSGSIERGGTYTVSVKASGDGLKYQWYFKKAGQTAYSAWKEYTHSSEKITCDGTWDELLFYCLVTDAAGHSVCSDEGSVTLKRALRVLAVGDSICRGGRNSHKGFVGDLGLPYLNVGLNSASLSTKVSDVTNIPDQLAAVDDFSPDIIIADGGANDYFYNAPLGKIPARQVSDPKKISKEALGTVTGGLQKLFALMKSKYPKAQRYFVITHKTTQRVMTKINGQYTYTDSDKYVDWTVTKNKAGYTQKELHDVIVACCKLYDVEVIDVYKESALNTADRKYCSEVSYMDDPSATANDYADIDGIHPLERGYTEYYLPVIRRHIKSTRPASELQLEIMRQPRSQTISAGEPLTVYVKASGTGLTYQWYYKKSDQDTFSVWQGRNRDYETVTPNASWDGIMLYCVITDSKGNRIQSDTVTVTIQ